MCQITGNRRSHGVLMMLLFLVNLTDCTSVTARIGTKVILPCNCPKSNFLISWQRGETIVYTDNRTLTALQYHSRTEIQENNCSLILSQVHAHDEGVYTCYYNKSTFSYEHVSLQVAGISPHKQRAPKVSWNVPVASVVCGLLVVLSITLTVWFVKRRNQTQGVETNLNEGF